MRQNYELNINYEKNNLFDALQADNITVQLNVTIYFIIQLTMYDLRPNKIWPICMYEAGM